MGHFSAIETALKNAIHNGPFGRCTVTGQEAITILELATMLASKALDGAYEDGHDAGHEAGYDGGYQDGYDSGYYDGENA